MAPCPPLRFLLPLRRAGMGLMEISRVYVGIAAFMGIYEARWQARIIAQASLVCVWDQGVKGSALFG